MATATRPVRKDSGSKDQVFNWEGKDKSGKQVRGEMRAGGEAMVQATLRRQGILVTKVKKRSFGRGGKVTEKDITLFTRQLATMMKAGVPLLQAFDIVGKGAANGAVSRLLGDIKLEVESGSSLNQAFRKYPQHFDPLFCNLVSAGEQAGILDSLLDRLATRIGRGGVRKLAAVDTHIPEQAQLALPAIDAPPPTSWPAAEPGEPPLRPFYLFDPPQVIEVIAEVPDGPPHRFRWKRQQHHVVRFEGPERIAPAGWREKGTARLRDYYRIEDREGRRYWIYREGVIGDGRGGLPASAASAAFPQKSGPSKSESACDSLAPGRFGRICCSIFSRSCRASTGAAPPLLIGVSGMVMAAPAIPKPAPRQASAA